MTTYNKSNVRRLAKTPLICMLLPVHERAVEYPQKQGDQVPTTTKCCTNTKNQKTKEKYSKAHRHFTIIISSSFLAKFQISMYFDRLEQNLHHLNQTNKKIIVVTKLLIICCYLVLFFDSQPFNIGLYEVVFLIKLVASGLYLVIPIFHTDIPNKKC